jgi:hypothetical protein
MRSAARRAPKKKSARPAASKPVGNEVFAALRAMLAEHVPPLRILVDKPTDFQLVSATQIYKGRPLWVAGVRQGKNYTSVYLMPVYAFPELLSDASAELKRRKQGKSCFNFTAIDPALFAELKTLAAAGIPRFDSATLIAHVEKKVSERKKR